MNTKSMFHIASAATTAAMLAYVCMSETAMAKSVVMDDAARTAAAKGSLVSIRDLALRATTGATSFKATVQANRLSDVVVERQELNELRASLNEMGRHVVALDADRANLAPWETAALDHITPVLRHAAATLTSAIEFSKNNPNWTASPINTGYANSLEKDMHQIHKTIDEYLHRAKSEQAVKRAEQQFPAPFAN